MAYNFRMLHVKCNGVFRGCDNCKDTPISEGYCKLCKRPLWRSIGETCNKIIAYIERNDNSNSNQLLDSLKEWLYRKQGKIHFVCTECNCITTIGTNNNSGG